MVMPLMLTGQYEKAVEFGFRAHDANPSLSSTYKGLVSALGLLGRRQEAAPFLEELLRLEPGFCVRAAVRRSPLLRQQDLERYAAGLRAAGCRERAWFGRGLGE